MKALCTSIALLVLLAAGPSYAQDPLPSWNDGKSKKSTIEFVTKTTTAGPNDAGKPEGIHLMIGRRLVAAFGNSTGDQQMLE